MVQLLDGRVISRPIAGTRYRGRTDEEDRRLGGRAASSTPRSSPSTSCCVDLARNDVGPGGALRHREGRRDDDPRALQPRDAPHVAGVGRAGRRAARRSTCCGPRCRPARCRARRRCGPWRSSTSSSRPSAGPTPAWSATSTSPATSTPPSPSARWSCRPDGTRVGAGRRGHRGRLGAPRTRTSSAATRPRPSSPRCRPPGA